VNRQISPSQITAGIEMGFEEVATKAARQLGYER